jgi:hypothetical protein
MGRRICLDGLSEPVRKEIDRILRPRKVDISNLPEDDIHSINKVLLQKEIHIVREGLRQRKQNV